MESGGRLFCSVVQRATIPGGSSSVSQPALPGSHVLYRLFWGRVGRRSEDAPTGSWFAAFEVGRDPLCAIRIHRLCPAIFLTLQRPIPCTWVVFVLLNLPLAILREKPNEQDSL